MVIDLKVFAQSFDMFYLIVNTVYVVLGSLAQFFESVPLIFLFAKFLQKEGIMMRYCIYLEKYYYPLLPGFQHKKKSGGEFWFGSGWVQVPV